MTHGSLFSGIGGFDLAADWMGWDNIFHCEWNTFGQKILRHYWPNSKSYDDITKTDFTIHRGAIDVLTGGFPCQPYSTAGKRLGKADERHLWPEMLRAIREIRPRYVVGENVRGIISWNGGMVFDEVQADLEAEGYEVLPFLLPAAGVGACHERYRTWFVAYNSNARVESLRQERENSIHESKIITDTGSEQLQKRTSIDNRQNIEEEKTGMDHRTERSGDTGNASNTHKLNGDISRLRTSEISQLETSGIFKNNATNPNIRRQSGEEHGQAKSGRASKESVPNYWSDFPTQSPVCGRDDGLPTESLRQRIREDSMGALSEKEIDKILSEAATEFRNESIKGGGNAIVHQVAIQIFKAIEKSQILLTQ